MHTSLEFQPINSMWIFIKESFLRFAQQGAVAPSSSFLARRMTRPVHNREADVCIVELGAGTGSFTRHLLAHMSEGSRLFVFEINPLFTEHLRKTICDKRVQIIEADAANLRDHLRKIYSGPVDYVISGLPLGNFSKHIQFTILSEIRDVLSDTGMYVQFQYFLMSWPRIRSMFDARISGYEMRNIPPAFVYECRKRPISVASR